MLEILDRFIESVSGWLWGMPMIIVLFGCHLFLTVRLRFPQRKLFKAIKLSITKDKDADGDVSQFGALVIAIAATVGTGNIIGVAVAIALGGPGAVLWCWLSGIFGIATKYAEALLSVKYRVKAADGTMIGGPMYAIERGMGSKWKWLAVLFALFTLFAALGVGGAVQSNAFASVMESTFGVPFYMSAIIITSLVAAVTFFGVKGIANVCVALIPFMTLLYVASCIFILFINASFLGDTVSLIVKSAFSPQAAGGGFVGSVVITAARFGIARGLFSNESGLGSAPIVAAAAKSRNPVRQALISSTGTFWDTVIICALTGLVLVSSVLAYPDIDSTNGGLLTEMAFRKIPYVGSLILAMSIATFTLSTILGWGYYSDKAAQYLGGKKLTYGYRFLWLAFVFLGAIMSLNIVWNLADVMNALMAIPNVISLIVLSGVAAKETNYYLWDDRLDEYSHDELPNK